MLFFPSLFRSRVSHQIQRQLLSSLPAERAIRQLRLAAQPIHKAMTAMSMPERSILTAQECLVFANPVFGGIRVAIGLP
jgi:hypothetical protein